MSFVFLDIFTVRQRRKMLADSIAARQIKPATLNFQERFLECGIVSLLGTLPGFGRMPIAVADLVSRWMITVASVVHQERQASPGLAI
jgi:hypothetical protein